MICEKALFCKSLSATRRQIMEMCAIVKWSREITITIVANGRSADESPKCLLGVQKSVF